MNLESTHLPRQPSAVGRFVCAAERLLMVTLGAGSLIAPAQAADAVGSCVSRSAATTPPVVELYTSEGCSSCPPADRWLSKLTAQADVIALAFHVDYWDNLGWKDPFGNAAHTERQREQQAVNGSRFSYTPQVTINGVDSRQWSSLRAPITVAPMASPVQVQLSRDGDRYTAVVQAVAGASTRVGAYWAVTENALVSDVRRGENSGSTLAHDFVVREYRPVSPWATAAAATKTLTFSPAPASVSGRPRQVNLVVFNAASGKPVQAVKLGC